MILRKDYMPLTVGRRRRGFTLAEILVAATIFATLMAIVYGIFSSIEGGVAKVEANRERVRVMGFLLREISHNLASAYLNMSTAAGPGAAGPGAAGPAAAGPGATELAFVGENIDEDGFAADNLHFVSLASPLGGAVAPGGPKLISVRLERPPEEFLDEMGLGGRDKKQSFLNLREQQLLSMGLPSDEEVGLDGEKREEKEVDKLFDKPKSGIKWSEDGGESTDLGATPTTDSEPVWSIEIESFNVEFFDGTAWVDSWDSSLMNNTTQFGLLPWAVKIEIDFPAEDGESSYARRLTDDKDRHDFETVVTIPASYGLWPEEAAMF